MDFCMLTRHEQEDTIRAIAGLFILSPAHHSSVSAQEVEKALLQLWLTPEMGRKGLPETLQYICCTVPILEVSFYGGTQRLVRTIHVKFTQCWLPPKEKEERYKPTVEVHVRAVIEGCSMPSLTRHGHLPTTQFKLF